MSNGNLTRFQQETGLIFKDRSLLLRAVTHPSYLNENPTRGLEDNQRLEFLGDAILDFLSGELLYNRFPEAQEGRLTRLRAALVRRETLAAFALECGLNRVLLLGHGEEENHGREREGNLCNAFEALIGALYLDQGIEAVRAFVNPMFERALDEIIRLELDKDPKSQLQEYVQRHLGATPIYETVRSEGPDHAKVFTVAVVIGGRRYAEGVGTSKQMAAQEAARLALETLRSGVEE
ncbi:MAG: ribonuclease III [Anaerolineae bacterium]